MSPHDPHGLLEGCRVLVVEDDWLVAQDLHRGLERHGAEVLGPVPSVAEATDLLVQGVRPTAALLDVRLGIEVVFPLADLLRRLEVPFAFATACPPSDLPETYAEVPFCPKPLTSQQLVKVLGCLAPRPSG